MEDSRTVLRSLSKTKKSYIRREGHDENEALDVNQKEQQEQLQTQQQEYRRVGRKIYNSRKQVVKQDPRNASAQKATKDQLPGEEEITYPYAVGEKKAHKDKTEEELEQERIEMENDIRKHEESYYYSEYYFDDEYEYRHVVLPKQIIKWIPHSGLLSEEQWRKLGIKQSKGWAHYMVYAPEPHIVLFKREINYIEKYGNEDKKAAKSKDTSQQAT